MLDITQLNKIDINSPQVFLEIKEKVADIMLHFETKEAKILYDFINEKLVKNKNIYQAKEYSKILSQLRFLDLYFLSDNEIVGLYQKDFGKILEYYEDYNPFSVLRLKLLNMSLRNRDEFKKRVVLALLNNREIITKNALFFVKGGKSEPPSIANWIRDYTKIAGGGVFTNIAKANYFIKSKNYLALSDEEEQKVKVLLNFYFRLQLSSLTPQGLENDLVFIDKDGKTKILSEGKIIDTSRVTMSANEPIASRKIVKTGVKEEVTAESANVSVEAEQELAKILEEEINQDTNGDFEQLVQVLNQSVNIGAREEIEAVLQILRKQGKINDIYKKPELLNDLKDIGFLNEFKLEKTEVEKAGKTTKELMKEILIGDKGEEREIKKFEAEIKKNEVDDVKKIINGLQKYKSPQPPFAKGGDIGTPQPPLSGGNIREAVARLRLLAKVDPNSFIRISGSETESPSSSDFEKLIKNILGEKLGMSETESARYGMQIAMILKRQKMPEFMKAVYFDKKDRVFRWNRE
jgi:hypothetical protein